MREIKNYPDKTFLTQEDIDKQIEEGDLNYLTKMKKFLQMDIDNIGKNSEIIKEITSKIWGCNEDKQLKYFTKLMNKIDNRIAKLK